MVKSTAASLLWALALALGGCQNLKPAIVYGRADGQRLWLDTNVPDGDGPYPVVILVHGGGWSSGDKRNDFKPIMGALTDAKFTLFSINYRLAPTYRWPACFQDVQTAIRWVKAHAGDFKGDPNRIALIGYSAGGHLVCYAAVKGGADTQVQAIVGMAPPTDLNMDVDLRGHQLSKALQKLLDHPKQRDEATRKMLYEMSPVNFVRPGLPPFLIIHGDKDKGCPYPETTQFVAKLKENGVPYELITIHGADHNINKWEQFDPDYKQKMVAWLCTTLAPSPAAAPGH